MEGGAVGHIFERAPLRTIPARFRLIWFSGFRGKDLNVIFYQNLPSAEGFLPPKIVGTFYMQGYKVKEKTAIVPPVSKLSGHPEETVL
jgi:hypothetical protein